MPSQKNKLKEILEEKGLSDKEIVERIGDILEDEELALKQKPEFGFKTIKVKSGKFRVIDKRGLFITPELTENEANRIAKEMNLRNPENKLKIVRETGIWYEF